MFAAVLALIRKSWAERSAAGEELFDVNEAAKTIDEDMKQMAQDEWDESQRGCQVPIKGGGKGSNPKGSDNPRSFTGASV